MKRYLLFVGDSYYAGGGWDDFMGDYDNPREAYDEWLVAERDHSYDWYHIVDTENKEVIFNKNGSYCGQILDKNTDAVHKPFQEKEQS